MNPNWSKLASLFRTLVILGASSFCGAVVLPIATDGSLPTTWVAWRPILAVAASAAAVAEFLWIRAHLQTAAQAIGVVANDANTPPAVKAALMKVTLSAMAVLVAVLCFGCTPAQSAQAQTDTGTAIDLTNAVCALAPDAPQSDQTYVDVICTLLQGGEQLVSVVIGAVSTLEGDGGTTTAMQTATSAVARVPIKQIRFTIQRSISANFLAAHAKR
jgi:hypothetical protein